MTIIRVKGFKIFRDRHGHWRCYHRKTGLPIDLKKTPIGSAEFLAECGKIAVIADAKAAEKERPGTLGLLICDYRSRLSFKVSRIGPKLTTRTFLAICAQSPTRH